MKKMTAVFLTLLMVVACFSSCNEKQTPAGTDIATTQVQPDEKPAKAQSDASAPQNETLPSTNQPGTTDEQYIGVDSAKNIALERAGLNEADVVFEKAELDYDDGVWKYEIEFRSGRTEYDVDIKANDGTVLSFESDYDD